MGKDEDDGIGAYLDTCIVSGLAKEDLASVELEALAAILNLHKQGRIELVTSSVTEEELSRVAYSARQPHLTIYALLPDVPVTRAEWTDGGLMLMGVGGGRRVDPLYQELRERLPDEQDAQHVFQAIKAEVPYFVTTDQKTILRHAKELEDSYGIVALLPSRFVARLAE